MFVFKSIYGDAERPRDGQRLDTQTVSQGPPGIYNSQRKNEFEQKIWSDFWKVCNNRKLQKELGIRASQGEASYLEAEEGKTYQVSIRASGGMDVDTGRSAKRLSLKDVGRISYRRFGLPRRSFVHKLFGDLATSHAHCQLFNFCR